MSDTRPPITAGPIARAVRLLSVASGGDGRAGAAGSPGARGAAGRPCGFSPGRSPVWGRWARSPTAHERYETSTNADARRRMAHLLRNAAGDYEPYAQSLSTASEQD